MTVGIAAVCESETENPKIVIAADRRVTSGRLTKIEYEHTQSKLKRVYSNDVVHCMAVTSGDTSLSDDFFHKLSNKLDDVDPHSVEQIAQKGIDSYQDILRETVNRSVLNPFDLTLSDLYDEETDIEPEAERALYNDAFEQQKEVRNHLTILLAGVDGTGTHLSSIPVGDIERHDSIGYHAIGSGGQPARTSFIRAKYDTGCDIETALRSVVEAKKQSEPAQGVGEEMDITTVDLNGCDEFEQPDIDELVDYFEDIVDAEENARGNVIEERGYTFELDNDEN